MSPVLRSDDDRGTHYVAAVLAALERRGDDVVLRWRGRPVSGEEFHRSITAAAAGLRALGVRPGATVGILTEPNSPLTLTARYAAHLLGGTVVHLRSTNPGPLAPALPASAQAGAARESRTDLLMVDAAHADRGREIAGLLTGSGRPLALAGFGDCGAGVTDLTAAPPGGDAAPSPAVPPGLAVITFTSGTTGRPKGVCQSFDAWNRTVLAAFPAMASTDEVRFLVVTPVSHAVAVILDIVLAAGGSVVLHERFDPGPALRDIEAERITGTYMAVPQLYAMLDHPSVATADLSSLRQVMYGGCPASPARLAEAVPYFGAALMQNYGTSEGGRITLLGPADHRDTRLLGSVGRPFPEVELRICAPDGPETGRELPRGQVGEVWTRSPHTMAGYLGDPASTTRVLHDGWLRTGDLGTQDEDGYVWLHGRIDDVIKSRAAKVRPAEVEQSLQAHPAVANAAVYGVRDVDGLEHVHAAVALRPGARCTDDELRGHVAAALTALHAPVRVTRYPRLPLAESGKVDRRRLQEAAQAGEGRSR